MENSSRFNLLDIYRGVAALLVVLYHITLEMYDKFHFIFLGNFFRQGNIGVDFFFVLSGFIIFNVHNNDIGNRENIIKFFKKRAIRIFPSYWAIVTGILFTFLVLQNFISNKPFLSIGYLLATYTLFPHALRLIPASWTLTEELYFYTIFGFLLLIPHIRVRLISFLSIALILFFGSFFIQHTPVQEAYITPYLLEFVGGCFAGYMFSFKKKIIKQRFILLVLLSLLLYLVTQAVHDYFLRIPVITLSFGILVWATVAYETSFRPAVNKLLLLIGKASYIIYLMHAFIILILYKILYGMHIANNTAILLIISISSFIICITIPTIFYQIYEKPVLKLLRNKII